MSADLNGGQALDGTRTALRVEAVFQVSDEARAQTLAAQLVDRAHEIANQPECECDVDVSVEWVQPDGPIERGVKPTRGHPVER